jgi:small-conductance mechanosensitive channel
MTIKEILDHTLVSTKHFDLTVSSVVVVVVTIILTVGIVYFIRLIFNRMIAKERVEKGTGWSIFLIIKYLIWTIVIIVMLNTIGIKISILLASVAALLVGVGFGIQQLFNDIASGIIILLERDLKINDIIQLDDGTVGRVTKIGLRTSMIITRDDITMIIPNSKFVNDKVINWSHIEKNTRFHIDVGVSYGSDVVLVKKLLLDCAARHQKISAKPAPFVRFADFGDSSLDFQLYFWLDDTFLVENIKSDLRFMITEAFNANGIVIPFPQRDVHMK